MRSLVCRLGNIPLLKLQSDDSGEEAIEYSGTRWTARKSHARKARKGAANAFRVHIQVDRALHLPSIIDQSRLVKLLKGQTKQGTLKEEKGKVQTETKTNEKQIFSFLQN